MNTKAKPRNRKASANKIASGNGAAVPRGMKSISGSFAPTWEPEKGAEITGKFSDPKTVKLRQGGKEVERRCVEFTSNLGERVTIWESAGLKVMFENVTPGEEVFIRYDGLGVAKKGQNAPKLFTVAVTE